MRTNTQNSPTLVRRASLLLATTAAVLIGSSCDEKLPSGPNAFPAQLQIVVPRDTIVVGDSAAAQAKATDSDGHLIQALHFGWASADSGVIGFAEATTSDADAASGRTRMMIGRRTGRSMITLALPDPRFVVPSASRNETVVVGGVRVLTSHDSTLSAVNDTGVAIAAGLVRANGALVTRASQGVHWTHLGQHTTVVGEGDTIRYVARTNGADTLIASHDFCLATAKCADTVVARVSQQLVLTLSIHTFAAWSFGDTLGPSVTLADRRGNGLSGTSVRFVPATTADSAAVRIIGPFGTSNPGNGSLAAPQMISTGNGTAKVRVFALAPDASVIAIDSITEVVRQVARHVGVEPLRATITSIDSIPIKAVARDARGAVILDAPVFVTPIDISVHSLWAGPSVPVIAPMIASITPTLTGISLPQNNPAAPQVPVAVQQAIITIVKPDTVKAGATSRNVVVAASDSMGQPPAGKWVRFGASFGPYPDSAQFDASGTAVTVWIPRDTAGSYTLTGIRGTAAPIATLSDSAGRVMLRQSVEVIADLPSETKTTVEIASTNLAVNTATTLTVTVRDRFGNKVKTAAPSDFVITNTPATGTIGAFACSAGVCTASYTAPAAATTDSIVVKVNGANVQFSPLTVTIHL